MSDVSGKYAPVAGNIPGVPVNLGGRVFVLAPLGLRLAREAAERGKAIQSAESSDEAAFGFGLWMIHQSILRNYPDVTIEEVEELLDQGNIREASDAIAGLSGMKRVTPGEIAPRS